jgi:hypothetical protein
MIPFSPPPLLVARAGFLLYRSHRQREICCGERRAYIVTNDKGNYTTGHR